MYLAPREQTWQEELGESKAPDFPLLGVGSESGRKESVQGACHQMPLFDRGFILRKWSALQQWGQAWHTGGMGTGYKEIC